MRIRDEIMYSGKVLVPIMLNQQCIYTSIHPVSGGLLS